MSSTLEEPWTVHLPTDGGLPARRAMWRWAWRLFRHEWRQQLLILTLIVAAVAATVVGSAIATNTPPPASSGFGTAQDAASFPGSTPHLAARIAALARRFGPVDVIENQTLAIPGSVDTYQVRAQNPDGLYGRPMLALVAGHYPSGGGEVAVTRSLAADFRLRIGSTWRAAGVTRRVVGIVENPQDLLSAFALVAPGQLRHPTQVTVLFANRGVDASGIGANVATASAAKPNSVFNPQTISLALATLLMLLIGLVSVGGFTVLAQRRLRSIAMLDAVGATDRNIRLMVRANGAIVGIVGALLGFAVGLVIWLLYRPHFETSVHHLVGTFQLPWVVIGPAMALAFVATFLAASRPARAITRVPVVTALAGRPAAPAPAHRSAVPGVAVAVVSFFLLGAAAANTGAGNQLELVLGLIGLLVAVVLLGPLFLVGLARVTNRAPLTVRLAARDLARYRARSSSSLAAISLGILIAALICVIAAARYGNVVDYAGPNLAANQLLLNLPNAQGPTTGANAPANGSPTPMTPARLRHVRAEVKARLRHVRAEVNAIAQTLGASHVVELATTSATLQYAGPGRNFTGTLYVATPELLSAFGIRPAQVRPTADVLTMRPGFAGIGHLQMVYGNYFQSGGKGRPSGSGSFPCPRGECLATPSVQQVGALPSGTAAPNTVITEHAVHELRLTSTVSGWLVETPGTVTPEMAYRTRLAAVGAGLVVETKNDQPSAAEVIDVATLFGMLLALGVLAMSVGLIRSETAADLRTLAATGASSATRRMLTAATAGSLALLGSALGTVAAYIAALAYLRDNKLNGGVSSLGSVPVENLLILLIGLPLLATVIGWVLAGREPAGLTRQPIG